MTAETRFHWINYMKKWSVYFLECFFILQFSWWVRIEHTEYCKSIFSAMYCIMLELFWLSCFLKKVDNVILLFVCNHCILFVQVIFEIFHKDYQSLHFKKIISNPVINLHIFSFLFSNVRTFCAWQLKWTHIKFMWWLYLK